MSTLSNLTKNISYILSIAIILLACAPKSIVTTTMIYPPLSETESFLVITEEDTIDISSAEVIGEIRIKDNGLSFNCNYETVLALATKEARQKGANGLKIYEHQGPDLISTCHRIKAQALRLKNVREYEKEITWHPGRRLEQLDFKGTLENRPFRAATMSYIRYNYFAQPFSSKFTFQVETVFDCRNSYLKEGNNPELVLEHEQGHFDMAEIFARKYLKAIQNQVHDLKDFEKNHARLYREIQEAMILEQDKYDTDIYADRSKQKNWLQHIDQELENLEAYSDKKIELPLVNKSKS